MSLTGSRKDVRLEGLCEAKNGIGQAVELLLSDGVFVNARDGWPDGRKAKWFSWVQELRKIQQEMYDEAQRIADEP